MPPAGEDAGRKGGLHVSSDRSSWRRSGAPDQRMPPSFLSAGTDACALETLGPLCIRPQRAVEMRISIPHSRCAFPSLDLQPLFFPQVMANVQPDHLKFGEPPISTTRLVSTDEDDKQKHVSSKPVKAALKGESRFLEIERAPDALQCFATGSGLATAIADRETGFEIVTYKLKGGHIDAIDVTITHDWKNNECKLPAKLHDNGDGSYSVKYEPTMHGVLKVCIQIEEVTIPRSPFFVQVKQRGSI